MAWLVVLLYICFYIFYVWCWLRVTKKAGFPLLGFVTLLPPLTIIVLIYMAFKEWKYD